MINTTEIGTPCGVTNPDCATLTCIPTSPSCTIFPQCPGTCQFINVTAQRIYTKCGGWGYYDDCDERYESCIADERTTDFCGPSCDGMGICWPFADYCSSEKGYERECGEGKACFHGAFCLPLRFGSDSYEKTGLEEVFRNDQNGRQGDE
ncbi:hypothetical protein QBC43DRAFT_197861 [Cladorrhinum sp. PSN259]|nr:hypothetical protein QBC43DRAFT_197861 [Cladorrhinum sp. PSN259]